MRRKISFMLGAVMGASLVLAPAVMAEEESSTEAESKVERNAGPADMVFSWWGNQTRNERTQQVIDMYTEEHEDVTIDGQFSEYSDYWQKLSTAAAGDTLPDVLQMDYSKIQQFVDNELLLDLTPYVEDGTLDLSQCSDSVIAAGQVEEGLYGVVNGVNAPALIYNKTLLDDAGITVKDNMTTDEFIELAKEVKEKTGYSTNYGYQCDQTLQYMLRGMGSELFSEDGKSLACTQEELQKYFDVFAQGIEEGWHISSAVYSEINLTAVEQDPLVYGSNPENMSWCAFVYSNQYTAYSNAAPEGTELAMTTWPAEDPQKANYLKPSQFFSVSTDCENPDAAVIFLNYLINSKDCNEVLLGERGIPAPKDVSEDIAPLLDENSQKVLAYVQDVVTPNCSTISAPDPTESSTVYDLLQQIREKICYGKMTGEEAAEEFYTEASDLLAK